MSQNYSIAFWVHVQYVIRFYTTHLIFPGQCHVWTDRESHRLRPGSSECVHWNWRISVTSVNRRGFEELETGRSNFLVFRIVILWVYVYAQVYLVELYLFQRYTFAQSAASKGAASRVPTAADAGRRWNSQALHCIHKSDTRCKRVPRAASSG